MKELRNIARIAVVLGIVSIVAVVLSHLALTDIAHGEPDVTGEWLMLQVAFGAIVAFQAVALTTLVRFLRTQKRIGSATPTSA